MLPYFIIFALVALLAYLSDRMYTRNKKLSIAFAILSIILLSVFAGIRDYSVGTDVIHNRLLRFDTEVSANTFLGRIGSYHHMEYGYSFFNYIVSRFTNDFHVFLFMHQAVLLSIVYSIAFREKKCNNTRIWLTVLVYLFLWFNTSLNIMRQSVAIFIQLYAYKYIETKKYKKYILFSILASLFHTSSIVFAFMPLLNMIYQKNRSFLKTLCSVLIIVLSFSMVETLLSVATELIPGLQRYEQYVLSDSTNLNIRYLLYKIIMCSFLVAFDLIGRKNNKSKTAAKTNLLSMLSIFDVVFYSLSGFIMYGYRMSYFFLVHNIIYIPRIESNLKGKNRSIFIVITMILLVGYWINRFILSHYDGTLPYVVGF